MTPLIETFMLIAIAIVVVILMCWVLGMFKEPSNEITQEPSPDENEPVIIEMKEEPKVPARHYAPAIPTRTSNGRTYSYTILNKWYLAKDGDYYQTIKSSQNSIFYVTKEGKRRYLSAKEKENLKEFM